MISHGCHSPCSTNAWGRVFQRLGRFTRHLFQRYEKWKEMRHHHHELLRMEDRMLKDIGLSRAEAVRMTRGHNFWKFVFMPEAYENAYRFRPERKCDQGGTRGRCVIDFPSDPR